MRVPSSEPDVMTEQDRVTAARMGDGETFGLLTRPFERELHVHCYRMLGSLADADDALQETLLNAWRGLDRFVPRAPLRAWLYRIATNVCLTMLARRRRRSEVPASQLSGEAYATDGWITLDPYPDALLGEGGSETDPLAVAVRRESVELALIAAVQFLPARQRAALLLHDVLGFPTGDVAAMLHTSVGGTNSVLQRARSALTHEQELGRVTRRHVTGDPETERRLVRRLVDAWHAADVGEIVSLLTDDAVVAMPPEPMRVTTHREIARFLSTVPARGRLDRFSSRAGQGQRAARGRCLSSQRRFGSVRATCGLRPGDPGGRHRVACPVQVHQTLPRLWFAGANQRFFMR